MTYSEYAEWLLDASQDHTRVLLFTAEHSTGIVRIASEHWQSDAASGYLPFDGWMLRGQSPVLEDRIDNFLSVGTVPVYCGEDTDWRELDFHGRPAQLLYGARDWPLADFRVIATAVTDQYRADAGRTGTFDLSDAGDVFNQFYTGPAKTRKGSATYVLGLLSDDVRAGPVTYTNVSSERLQWTVELELDSSTVIIEAMRRVLFTIGAFVRIKQTGGVEVFVPPSTDEVVITQDDIERQSVVQQAIEPAYARVSVSFVHEDLSPITRLTNVDTGVFDATDSIDIALTGPIKAETVADDLRDYRSVRHIVRRMRVTSVAALLQVGTRVGVVSEQWTGSGIVTAIRREPRARFQLIEVIER